MEGVGSRVLREPSHGRPFPSFEASVLKIPVSILLRRPDEPDPALGVFGQRYAKEVAAARAYPHRIGPTAVLERTRQNLIASIAIRNPGHPDSAVARHCNRRVIILELRRSDALGDGLAFYHHRPVQEARRLAVNQLLNLEMHVHR